MRLGRFRASWNAKERGCRDDQEPKGPVDVIGCAVLVAKNRYAGDRKIEKTAVCEMLADTIGRGDRVEQ
jgi:hypothetical protein